MEEADTGPGLSSVTLTVGGLILRRYPLEAYTAMEPYLTLPYQTQDVSALGVVSIMEQRAAQGASSLRALRAQAYLMFGRES